MVSQLSCMGWTSLIVVCLVACGCQTLTSQQLSLENTEVRAIAAEEMIPNSPGADPQTVLEQLKQAPSALVPGAELQMVSLPEYRIEPPDVLLINAVRMAPKPPYFIKTLDILQIVVLGTPPDQPIAGQFQIDPSGTVNLGPSYGSVKISKLSINEAKDQIRKHLQKSLTNPEVSVSLIQLSGMQQIAGEHLVGPDGTVNLGIYGNVYVAGKTMTQAREILEEHLSQFLDEPMLAVDVYAYNSKWYYILFEGAGFGDQITRVPITGNETVLDAISQVGGLRQFSSTKIWIARPAPSGIGCDQILPVDWQAITKSGNPATNYQLLRGDRIYIAEDRMFAFDALVGKLTRPFERIAGFSLLWSQAIQNLQRFPSGFRGNN